MNGVVHFHAAGYKLGNATMAFLHAYAHAQRVGAEFVATPWIGERVFKLPYLKRPPGFPMTLPVRSEMDLRPDETNVRITAYAQSEKAMIYTKEEAKEWLQLRHSLEEVFNVPAAMEAFDNDEIVGHARRGDYFGYGYPVVSLASYRKCVEDYGLASGFLGNVKVSILTEEHPTPCGKLPSQLSFLPDFYRMVYAPILLRANSTFSWVAGLLNREARAYSPVIDGLKGGQEHLCRFVQGNWPKLCNLDGYTDLHVKDEVAA